MDVRIQVDPALAAGPVRVALVVAGPLPPPAPEGAAPAALGPLLARVAAEGEALWPPGRRERVRDMLRHGRFKPTGRAKPSSEFLLQAAGRGEFPLVSPVVDVNNLVSLETGFPASVFDAALTGGELLLRRGLVGESYVFNRAGHEIDLTDLVVVCRRAGDDWGPCGNPIKDAMATKVGPVTERAVGVLYAPAAEPAEALARAAERYAALLREHAGAAAAAWEVC
jgi:DNA/RNA-binding domain of Phe-tRNA-synthetase-like protein